MDLNYFHVHVREAPNNKCKMHTHYLPNISIVIHLAVPTYQII